MIAASLSPEIMKRSPRFAFWQNVEAWRVVEDIEFGDVTVPAGFSFNGVSSPWFLAWVFPRSSSHTLAAAAIHDWLDQNYLPHSQGDFYPEEQFELALRESDVSPWRRVLMVAATRHRRRRVIRRRRRETRKTV